MYCYVVDSDICYFIQDLCAYKFFLIGNCDFFFQFSMVLSIKLLLIYFF